MNKERRRENRVQPAFRVRTEVLQEEGNIHMAIFADIVNLSEGGICLRSPLRLNIKDRMIIFLPRLDHRIPLELHGTVVWTKIGGPYTHEYGMKFSGLDADREASIGAELKGIMDSYFTQSILRLNDDDE